MRERPRWLLSLVCSVLLSSASAQRSLGLTVDLGREGSWAAATVAERGREVRWGDAAIAEPGRCAMSDSCGRKGGIFGSPIPCVDNAPAHAVRRHPTQQ